MQSFVLHVWIGVLHGGVLDCMVVDVGLPCDSPVKI